MPSVAASASGFLLAWHDRHDSDQNGARIVGLRTDANGNPIEDEPFLIGSSTSLVHQLAVGSDGTNYLVSWRESELVVRFVPAGGVVTAPNPVWLGTSATAGPNIIGGAEGFLVLWENESGPSPVRASRITSGGAVLDPSGVPMDLLPTTDGALGSDGSNYIFVARAYVPSTATYGTFRWRISAANASVSSPEPIPLPTTAFTDHRLAFNGSRFLLLAGDSSSGVFLNPDGTFLGPGPSIGETGGYDTRVTARNGEFLIIRRTSEGDLRALRFSGNGAMLGSNQAPANLGSSDSISLAAGPPGFLVFREQEVRSQLDVLGLLLHPDGSFFKQFSPDGPNSQHRPGVTSDGAGFLAVWHESRDGTNLVVAARLDSNGTLLGGPLIVGEGSDAQASFAAGSYLVVWSGPDKSILGRRLHQAGGWADAVPIRIATNTTELTPFSPSVGSSGTNFLVVWNTTQRDLGGYVYAIMGAVLGTSAAPSSNGVFRISPYRPFYIWISDPVVTFSGSQFVVAWSNYRSSLCCWYNFADWARVSPSGIPGTVTGLLNASFPSLTASGNTALLGWNLSNNFHVAELGGIEGTEILPNRRASTRLSMGLSLVAHRGGFWLAGYESASSPKVSLTALDEELNTTVQPLELPQVSGEPALASNGTNLLCVYETPAVVQNISTPRVKYSVLYTDTTLHVRRTAPASVAGYARHAFVLDHSPDLAAWTPYRTNTATGTFEWPASSNPKQFFRMRWHSP